MMRSLKEIFFDFENNYLFAMGGSALGSVLLVGLFWKAFKVKMKAALQVAPVVAQVAVATCYHLPIAS